MVTNEREPVQSYKVLMIEILVEHTDLKKVDWAKKLNCTREELEELLSLGILTESGQNLKLTFVGIFVLSRGAWYCRPKIFQKGIDMPLVKEIDLLSSTLKRYESRSDIRKAYKCEIYDAVASQVHDDSVIKEIEILLSLIDWTLSFGFHSSVDIYRQIGSGFSIDWSITVNSSLPLFNKKSVIYHDPVWVIGNKNRTYLSILQAKALCDLYDKYEPLSSLTLGIDKNIIEEARTLIEEYDSDIDLSNYLWTCYNSTNKDHDKELISTLISHYVDKLSFLQTQKPIRLFGTRAFNLVWEDMCRYALSNGYENSELSNPIYRLGAIKIVANQQRPDVIFKWHNKIYIVDAKYYTNIPYSLPGTEDVTKQIMYGLSHKANIDSICLAFLMPRVQKELITYAGIAYMEYDSMRDKRFPEVHCFILSWWSLLEAYVGASTIPDLRAEISNYI